MKWFFYVILLVGIACAVEYMGYVDLPFINLSRRASVTTNAPPPHVPDGGNQGRERMRKAVEDTLNTNQ